MNIDKFSALLSQHFSNVHEGTLTRAGRELNYKIQETAFYCRKLSTPQIGLLLNLAVRCLNDDEVYFNAGVWDGYSLLCAGIGNAEKAIIGVDNFSEMCNNKAPLLGASPRDYGPTRDNFFRALDAFRTPRLVFYEDDWRNVLAASHPALSTQRIGVAYYDAEHTAEAHSQFFEQVLPLLANQCLVIVDDIRFDFVLEANAAFMRRHDAFRVLMERRVDCGRHPAWWGGIQLIARVPA